MSSKNTKTNAKTVKAKSEPNLIFSGKHERINKETGNLEKTARDSPSFIINGRDKIRLPDDLSKGAYIEPGAAETAKNLFASDFKHPKPLKSAE